MSRFTDRTILLTGATRGVGAHLARLLLADGVTLVVPARDPGDLEPLSRAHPGRVDAHACDLSDTASVARFATRAAGDHPDLSGLINNAAIMVHTHLTRGAAHCPDITREIAINLTAPVTLSTLLLPVIARHGDGFIANVTSGLALSPKTDAAVYSATKAGLRSFTRALRNQCAAEAYPVTLTEALLPVVDTTLSTGDPATKMRPETAASAILAGISARQDEVYVGKAAMLRRVYGVSPALAHRIMARM